MTHVPLIRKSRPIPARACFAAVTALLILHAFSACSTGTDSGRKNTPRGDAATATGNAGENPARANAGGTSSIDVNLPDAAQGNAGEFGTGDACVADVIVGEHVPLDLYLLIDRSASMLCAPNQATTTDCMLDTELSKSRWNTMKSALKDFIHAPESAELGVGIGFFPLELDQDCMLRCRAEQTCGCSEACGCKNCRCSDFGCICMGGTLKCDASDYATPATAIASLPSAATKLTTVIDAEEVGSATPTVPALTGALMHLTNWLTSRPDRRAALVLATDGEPEGCDRDNSIAEAATAVKTALAAAPSIPTYVIGIGPSLENLHQVAQAGGTERAYLLGTRGNAVEEFLKALSSIRGDAFRCDFRIPNVPKLDYARVNVRATAGSAGEQKLLEQASTNAACGTSDGWYYDDPAAPKTIKLCEQTCKGLQGAAGSKLEILMGCKTIVSEPK